MFSINTQKKNLKYFDKLIKNNDKWTDIKLI